MDTQHEDPFMFQRGMGGGGGPPPHGMQLQQQMPPQMQQQAAITEVAKDRLTTYVYEFLLQTGATKTAEAFKEEVLNQNPALQTPVKPSEKTFLLDWWVLFWDLWSAAPERRELGVDPMYSGEAKYFHETMIGMPPGMTPPFGPPIGMDMMGGHPGAFGGRFQPGRMPPGGMPPGPFPPMFNPALQRMPNPALRMPPAPFPGAMGRPGVPGGPMGDMGAMPRYDFMGPGPQQFAGPSGSGMMPGGLPNGAMPHMSLNSPNMGPPPGADPNMPGGFMGMPPMPPTSSSGMPFGMTDQPMSAGPTGGAPGPGTPGMGGSVPGGGPGSVPPQATTSVGSVGTPGQSQLQNPKQEMPTSNGEEMKTEALTPTGASCGSVGAPASAAVASVSMNGTGPGSAPGSAHSVNNNVNPGTPSGGPMSNPLSNPMSNPPLSSGQNPGSADAFKDDNGEISKIREGLLDGFKTEVTSGGPWE